MNNKREQEEMKGLSKDVKKLRERGGENGNEKVKKGETTIKRRERRKQKVELDNGI